MSRLHLGSLVFVVAIVVLGTPSMPRGASAQASAQELFALYQQRRFDEVTTRLATVADWPRFADEVADRVRSWPVEWGAAFALESLHALFVQSGADFRVAGRSQYRLLESGFDRIRRADVDRTFALAWLRVRFALHHGFGPETANIENRDGAFAQQALALMPEEPEIQWLAAVSREQQLHEWLPTIGIEARRVIPARNPQDRDRVLARKAVFALMEELATTYENLSETADLGGEPTLRVGVMKLLNDDTPNLDALPYFERAAEDSDPWVAYLGRVFSGRIWLAEARPGLAVDAFRRASALRPTAQSARTGLAAALLLDGRQIDAVDEAARLIEGSSAAGDPWHWYAYGAYRRLPEWLRAMREVVR